MSSVGGLGFMVSVKGLGFMVFCEGFVVHKNIEAKKYQDIYFEGLTIDQSSKINVLIFFRLDIFTDYKPFTKNHKP